MENSITAVGQGKKHSLTNASVESDQPTRWINTYKNNHSLVNDSLSHLTESVAKKINNYNDDLVSIHPNQISKCNIKRQKNEKNKIETDQWWRLVYVCIWLRDYLQVNSYR